MHTAPILEYLKKHGQKTDFEIADATGTPLAKVRSALLEMSARGDISTCSVTRFKDGNPIEGMLCRVAGTIPAPTPGRKPS
jgi:hypothetical protein